MHRREALKTTALFLGYAVSTTALSNLFISCATANNRRWTPVFLNPVQANTISVMAERILPKTDTPGAKDLHIDRFIDLMLRDLLSPEEQKDFTGGLASFEMACQTKYGKPFTECSESQQEAYLINMDKEAAKLPPSVWGIRLAPPGPTPFFRRVKELTLLGYFSSEQISKNVLRYDPLPGSFVACMPYATEDHSWSE